MTLVHFRLHKIQTVDLVWPRAKNGRKKATSDNFGMVPPWKMKKGKTRNSWMQEVTTGMREREGGGIDGLEWVDREGRRWKIKL